MGLTRRAYLAIDAGGTYFKSAIFDAGAGKLGGSGSRVRSYSEGSREKITRAYHEIIGNALDYLDKNSLALGGIGISTPGPFDYINGIPLMKHKFSSIYGLRLREIIYNMPGVSRAVPIRFMHDANATLAGEIWKGNARDFPNAGLVTMGTGLGFAFSREGEVQCSELGGPMISIYSLPYKDGILEDYTAKRGFLKVFQELSGKKDITGIRVSDIGKWADEGDKISIHTFSEVGKIIALSLKNILLENNIECLLFGGQISRSFSHMESSVREGLANIKCLKKISAVKSIDDAALLGTLHVVMKDEVKDCF